MPLQDDLIRQLQSRTEVPAPDQPGSVLTAQQDLTVDWGNPPDEQILDGTVDPNGVVYAYAGRLYVQRGIPPALWQNQDGVTSWALAGLTAGDSYLNDGSVGGTVTVNYAAAKVHKLTLTSSITSLTLSGTTTGFACGLTLYLVQGGSGSYVVTWPGSVKWASGLPAVLSTTVGLIDIVVMETFDGGTSWFANQAGRAYS